MGCQTTSADQWVWCLALPSVVSALYVPAPQSPVLTPPHHPPNTWISAKPCTGVMLTTAYVSQHCLNNSHSGTINTLAFSPNGMYLASGSDDESVIIWSLPLSCYFYCCIFQSLVDSLLLNPEQDTNCWLPKHHPQVSLKFLTGE